MWRLVFNDRPLRLHGRTLLLTGWMLGLTLCGCRRHISGNKIVVIPHRISGPVWLSEHVGIGEAAERNRQDISWSGPNDEGSLDEQYELVERAIHEHAQGIILSPNADHVFKPVLMRAHDAGVPVVIEGEAAGLEPMPGVSFVLGNQEKLGRLIAGRLGAVLHHRGSVLIVGLDPRVPGNVERSDAIVAALRESEPGVQVTDRVLGSSSPAHSETLILQAISAHSDVRALVSLSSGESVAAASAIHTRSSLAGMEIIGCDQSQPVFMLLRMGLLDALIIEDNRREGAMAVAAIRDMRAGQYQSRTLLVDPVLVSRENVGTEAVQQLLLMHR